MKRLLLGCVVLLFIARPAEARRLRSAGPISVRMVSYVGELIKGVRPEYDWVVQYHGKNYTLHVLKLTVLRGNVLPSAIDAAVRPYRVQFQLAGQEAAIQHFIATPPRQQIVVTGFIRLDARYFMFDSVQDDAAGPPGN
jgi:hypothetical protein